MAIENGPSTEELLRHDERGILYLSTIKAVGKTVLTLAAVAVVAGGPIQSLIERNTRLSANVDLNKGHSESNSEILALNPSEDIDIADAYYKSVVSVNGIEITLKKDLPLYDPSFTVERNTEMTGIGPLEFELPHKAVTSRKGEGGETDFEVDASQVKVTVALSQSPVFRDYTITDGKKDFDDRSGFRSSFIGASASFMRLLNIDNPGNVIDDAIAMGDYEISRANLETVAKECPKQLTNLMPKLIEDALKKNLLSVDQNGKFGKVTFVNSFVYTPAKVPEPVKKAIEKNGIVATEPKVGKMTFDKVSCSSERIG